MIPRFGSGTDLNLLTLAKRSPFVLPLACIAAVTMLSISEGSYWRSVATLDELGAIADVRSGIQGLEIGLLDAESAQRDFLASGRADDLRRYETAATKTGESFGFLDRYYSESPASMQTLGKLHQLTETRLAELAAVIHAHDAAKVESRVEPVAGDAGGPMRAIRALSAELLDREAVNVRQSRNDLYRTLMLGRIGIAGLSAVSLLALFMYLRQTLALKRQQQQQQRLVQAERDRLEIEVSNRTAQLTQLTHHLQTAREDERSRLARDLHDELGALLTSAKLDAARIKSRLAGTAPEALERLAHLVDTLNSGIAMKRQIIEDLRPSALSNLGLVSTLEILAREFAERSGVEVHCALSPVKLEATAELMIYRLVQEAITNISKYAKASHVWLGLSSTDRQLEVSVRDDGVGFDTTIQPSSAHGLVGMRFRVEAEGGSLALTSAPGQGTTIRMKLPESALSTA
jgi:signal transduction histidine kinase